MSKVKSSNSEITSCPRNALEMRTLHSLISLESPVKYILVRLTQSYLLNWSWSSLTLSIPNPEGSNLFSIATMLAILGSSLWIPTASNSCRVKCYMNMKCSQLKPTWSKTPDVAFRSLSICLHLLNSSSSNFWSPSSPIELARLLERGSTIVKWFPNCLPKWSIFNLASGSKISC